MAASSDPSATVEGFEPTTFYRTTEDGEKQELTAYSPSDAVRLAFEGWSERKSVNPKAPARSTSTTTTAGDAGK